MTDELACRRLEEEGAVERYVARTLSAGELEEFESHLIECPRCQEEVRLAVAVRHAVGQAGASREIESARRFRVLRIAAGAGLAAAAALVVALATPELRRELAGELHRAPAATAEEQPIAPRGVVAALDTARWHPLPGAERYRVRVFDAVGEVLWEGETTDTVLHVAGLESLRSEAPYYWQVETRLGWNRWEQSELVEFRLLPVGRTDGASSRDPLSGP
ncbi:MAG: zf-HC2 domain-containing protein [Gemmatimonadota bacterium]|nr:MAG: zf-HC2 domain-containing protein [Gemmatimonadota bacterium]